MCDALEPADRDAPVPDRVSDDETPGPGRGGPRFGPVGGPSGGALEPGRMTAEPLPVPGEIGAATSWPERDEWALPARYGEDVVVALVRDPWWVFVYWELDEATRAAAKRRAGEGGRFVLRLYEVPPGDAPAPTAPLSETAVPEVTVGDWYVPVKAPRLRVEARMGFLDAAGEFHSVFGSAPVPVPAFEAVPPLDPPGPPDEPRPPEVELFEFSGGRELTDARRWREQRTRPVLWKRRQVGGWKTLRDGGSGSGVFGMEMRFGPPETETDDASPGAAPPPEPGPLAGMPSSDMPTSAMPTSPGGPPRDPRPPRGGDS